MKNRYSTIRAIKSSYSKIWMVAGIATALIIIDGCSKSYLEKAPLGALSEATLTSKAGVNGVLIGAYSLLDGVGGTGTGNSWQTSISNFHLGDIASDDSHKGSEYGDESWMEEVENYSYTSVSVPFDNKWKVVYGGVQRANDVLRLLVKVTDGSISDQEALQIKAEAVFLRGVYHFEAAKIWRNIPFVDETITFADNNYIVDNTTPAWPRIEADFQFAADNLTATKSDAGRANSWAAKAFLAKVYMFQHKYTEAKPLLADLISNGMTANGQHYALVNFADNFNPSTKNSAESVFAVQMSVNDGSSTGLNGRAGDMLNYASSGGPARCCGFNQPSFSLVNSYKTDANGLPLLDDFNNEDVKNDMLQATADPFTPYTGTLDPRLDHTVGRRGIPYLDWGIMTGASWIYQQSHAGPYIPIKNVYYQAAAASSSANSLGWGPGQATSNNYTMIRFADILLWAAEVEAEIGSLPDAEGYVNQVRTRAANPDGWVKTYIDENDPLKGFTNTPAANYKIGLYTGQFAANGQDYARKAVRFERKLELAMEGHRFFDLQRYDNGTGYMADVLNAYIDHENASYNEHLVNGQPLDYLILKGAHFTKGKNEIYPIPLNQIELHMKDGASLLQQNPGY